MDFITVRENNKEYTVAEVTEGEKDFTERMIMENIIPGLLPMNIREFNGEESYYFDTTGRIAFSDMFQSENDVMGARDVEKLCESIIRVSGSVREFLLDTDDIKLGNDTIFFNTEMGMYEFMYMPGSGRSEDNRGGFRRGLREIWERVLKKVGSNSNKDFIMKLYDIYQKMSVDNFDPENIFVIKEKEEEKGSESAVVFEKFKEPEEVSIEELYDEKKVEEIIEEESKTAPKKKKYAMYGGIAALAVAAIIAVV